MEAGSTSTFDKFNRRSMQNDSDDSEDEGFTANTRNVKPNELFEIDDLGDLPRFQTAETKQGIRVRSQQFRLQSENLVDRPAGVKRLEVLPLEEHERYRRIRSGRVGKSRPNSRASCYSRASNFQNAVIRSTDLTAGSFVEKGKFTYKFGDRNKDGVEGVIGIERNKQISAEPPAPVASVTPQININMDWKGFYQGFTSAVDSIPKAAPSPVHQASLKAEDDQVQAAIKLLEMIKNSGHGKSNFLNLQTSF